MTKTLFLVLMLTISAVSGFASGQKDIQGGDDSSTYQGSGLASAPQPIYELPGDHRFHAGEFYRKNAFFEWNYFTVLGEDVDTGEEVSFFWCVFAASWNKALDRPYYFNIMAFHSLETGEFHSATNMITSGQLENNGTDPSSPDFEFTYSMDDGTSAWFTHYDHATETWTWSGSSTNDSFEQFKENAPFDFDMTLVIEEPGYLPAAYFGLEAIGYTPDYRQNPETTWGLTRYIVAPFGAAEGRINIGGRERNFRGTAWYEHQWGNFSEVERSKYFWGYMRMDDGSAFTWRQYYKDDNFQNPDTGMTRYQHINRDGSMQYAFGPSFVYTPTEEWVSPISGTSFPWYGVMETPNGTFYFGPEHPSQESPAISYDGGFIEGVAFIREGSHDGPIVGRGFVEIVDGPAGMSVPPAFDDEELRMIIGGMNR